MAMPHKLKNMNLFIDGESHLGVIASVTLPKLAVKTEAYRGSFLSEVNVDMGLEPIELGWTPGGKLATPYRTFGVAQLDGTQLRFLGAYQADDTGEVRAVEMVVRGRNTEIDPGDAKPGDDTEEKVTTKAVYFKYIEAGETIVEIDVVNCIYITGGVDRYAEIRAAIGL